MKLKYLLALVLLGAALSATRADEGMWLPLLVEKYQIGEMKSMGFELDAEDIYSVNQACLKDAVVLFGRGCTGEMISSQGLVLTNHHCGLSAIQSHSSVENDYLRDGFWAMNAGEELPNPGLSVSFLRYMEDVSDRVFEGVEQGMDPGDRERLMDVNKGKIIREATSGKELSAEVRSFYYGNKYYLFVYERYTDVRLVGAPPEAVGNFGADNDNWVWPRHTGDFSLFRVYAGEDNKPADYSPENRPYLPKKHFEINAGGIGEGEFTMVMGYPASTQYYLHSGELKILAGQSYPLRVDLRTTRLEIMDRYMKTSDEIRIQYASKYRRVSNAWKKWQGVMLGLQRNDVLGQKAREELAFEAWVSDDGERQMKYGGLMEGFTQLYDRKSGLSLGVDLMAEAIGGIELFRQAGSMERMFMTNRPSDAIRAQAERFFKDYHRPIDEEITMAMLHVWQEKMPADHQPAFMQKIAAKGADYTKFIPKLYAKSAFTSIEATEELIDLYETDSEKAIAKLKKDPAYVCYNSFREIYRSSYLEDYDRIREEEAGLYKRYMAGLIEQADSVHLFPDANRSMRVSYGRKEGYSPADAVWYSSSTTLEGVMQKAALGFADYVIPEKLRTLYDHKDYGPYAEEGELPLCFIASNHTSGGNSGSPVLDGRGRLIGLNFDREWEGVMSDFYFDSRLSRNISVDIRYVLFLIDKLAGAGYLLEEMDIVWEKEQMQGE